MESALNANGWVNPYRYDGRDRALADPATGLDWLATRAYDPTIGRFLARDPLGRVPLFFADNPYAYAGNNPVSNVDPSGQYRAAGHGSVARESGAATNALMARVVTKSGCDKACQAKVHQEWLTYAAQVHQQLLIGRAQGIAKQAEAYFDAQAGTGALSFLKLFNVDTQPLTGTAIVNFILQWIDTNILSSPLAFLGNELKALTGGALVYDLVSLIVPSHFQHEASDGKNWWLDPMSLTYDDRSMQAVIGGFAVATAVVMIALTAMVPDMGPIWIVAGIFWMARINSLLPKIQGYIDQERRVFGYA